MKILLREIQYPETDEVYEMFQSFPKEENGFQAVGHGLSKEDFDEVIKKRIERSNAVPDEEIVPDTTYVLFVDDKCVGFGKLRHCLNEELKKYGGHIGYGIASQFRGKGYANILLSELLKKAKEKNIDKVLLTCNVDNAGSYKAIENNGGKLEKIENGHRYYWIGLS